MEAFPINHGDTSSMTSLPLELRALDLIPRLKRAPAEHKGNAGKVLLIGGASGMAGALILAGNACLHLGAGWSILEMLDLASAHVAINQPELMVRLAKPNAQEVIGNTKPDVIAIGPGLGDSGLAQAYLKAAILNTSSLLVIDADGLNLIADQVELLHLLQKRNTNFPESTVLTPHPGEAARLLKLSTEQVQENRLEALNKLVTLTKSMVVLKGQHTLVGSPLHDPVVCQQGNPGMGTGGMGDVLTGSIAAIGSQGIRHHLNLWESTCLAVQLHACAADCLVAKNIGPIGLTPSETILEMRSLLNHHLNLA